jgi:3-oxoacyl-[acyl-carrier protein] reductase
VKFSLQNKVILITGSSRGIGAGIARCVKEHGGLPVITYQYERAAAEELCKVLGTDDVFQLDVSSRSSVQALLDAIIKKYGRLDALVNNAGILNQKPFLNIDDEAWDHTLAVNLKGPFIITQEAIKRHTELQQTDMRIINISSVGGQFGGPKAPHYSASKGALITFTKSSARLFASIGVRVNAISPGFIRTEMYDHILEKQDERSILHGIPLGKVGEPDDVGSAVVYLASQAGQYITGQVLNVNGGSYI